MSALTSSLPDLSPDKPPRQRRWFPLSLRMFGAMLLLLGGSGLWVGVPAYRQQVFIREVERNGGEVFVREPRLDWPRTRLGIDWKALFGEVILITSHNRYRLTDSVLANVGRYTSLQTVSLDGTLVTDAGLSHLKGLTGLTYLSLCWNRQLTDTGLWNLAGFTHLEELWLDGTGVTDVGLSGLKGLPRLNLLSLNETQVTGTELWQLKELPNLGYLWLDDTQLSDAGLVHVGEIISLKSLFLGGTHVSDAGLVHLRGLRNLWELRLDKTDVTDAGLSHLKELTSLRQLSLRGTAVTEGGIAELQRALPEVHIHMED